MVATEARYEGDRASNIDTLRSMITRVEHARYCLRLRKPLAWGGTTITEREGLLVALCDSGGRRGFGEIAPLPGFHRESLPEAERALVTAADKLRGTAIEENAGDMCHVITGIELPSVVFGIEMAWLGLLARRGGCTPASIMCDDPAPRIPLNALCDADLGRVQDLLHTRALVDYPVVKVKVGRGETSDEHTALKLLMAELPEANLRLDGNRSLDPESARRLVHGLPAERIDYFEEPLSDTTELERLASDTGIRIALDETLREPKRFDVADRTWVAAWIVKPSLAGGFGDTLVLAKHAREDGIEFVISSCFESGLGLEALAQLAASVAGAGVPAGLGTDRWLEDDLREPRFDSSVGSIETSDWIGEPSPSVQEALGLRETLPT